MLSTRTYQITTDDLQRLHLAMEEAKLRNNVCVHSRADLCDDCKEHETLLQHLRDAIIMHAAGADIILTTQLQSAEKTEEGTIQ